MLELSLSKIQRILPIDPPSVSPAEARGEAPSEAANRLWLNILDKVRTFYQQNLDAD
jgi:hypothetical protein